VAPVVITSSIRATRRLSQRPWTVKASEGRALRCCAPRPDCAGLYICRLQISEPKRDGCCAKAACSSSWDWLKPRQSSLRQCSGIATIKSDCVPLVCSASSKVASNGVSRRSRRYFHAAISAANCLSYSHGAKTRSNAGGRCRQRPQMRRPSPAGASGTAHWAQ